MTSFSSSRATQSDSFYSSIMNYLFIRLNVVLFSLTYQSEICKWNQEWAHHLPVPETESNQNKKWQQLQAWSTQIVVRGLTELMWVAGTHSTHTLKPPFWSNFEGQNPDWKYFHQTSCLHTNRKIESVREIEWKGGGGDCISGHWLLIATRHTSPQLSQTAIEKWPVMQLLANPGPWLPSIIKSCLSRGLISRLSWCVVSLSHLPATSWPAATAGSGIRFLSATSHSVEHIRWYGAKRRNWNCCIIYSNGFTQGEVVKVTQ